MVAVIGDVHGCFNTFEQLVRIVRERYPDIDFYCTGDLIDRGRFPHLAIEFAIAENILPVLGNHECMFYYYNFFPDSHLAKLWTEDNEHTEEAYFTFPHLLEPHLEYISMLPFYHNLDDCFISHAGIAKKFRSRFFSSGYLSEQAVSDHYSSTLDKPDNILWNREDLLDIGKLQIVGHTRKRSVELDESNNALYIDTSAFSGRMLTCAVVEDSKVVDLLSVETDSRDI